MSVTYELVPEQGTLDAWISSRSATRVGFRRTLTYDQGKELADDRRLALDTGMPVYFAAVHAWRQ
jgi:IS30 family transposase